MQQMLNLKLKVKRGGLIIYNTCQIVVFIEQIIWYNAQNYDTLLRVNIRTYNDKAYTSPHLFGQFFNFRIFIKFFIHEVKKTSKF